MQTRTLVDLANSDLALGRTSFRIVWWLMYLLIVLKTLIAASCTVRQNWPLLLLVGNTQRIALSSE